MLADNNTSDSNGAVDTEIASNDYGSGVDDSGRVFKRQWLSRNQQQQQQCRAHWKLVKPHGP